MTHDPNVMAKQLSEGVGPQSHYELSKVGGYKGELEMDSPVNVKRRLLLLVPDQRLDALAINLQNSMRLSPLLDMCNEPLHK